MSGGTAVFCPYRGLEPFDEDGQAYFFGREPEADTVAANLETAPLTVLYGPSGVGKSSLLAAGVIPALRRAGDLLVVSFRTWSRPTFEAELCEAIRAAVPPEKRGAGLAGEGALDEVLKPLADATEKSFVVILDQFEEYCLYHAPGSPRGERFDSALARAINRRDIPTKFLLSVREEGLSLLDRFKHRIPHLLSVAIRLKPMGTAGARAAVEKPLERYRQDARHVEGSPVAIEPSLREELLRQVQVGRLAFAEGGRGAVGSRPAPEEDAGAVETPFLQMVLRRLWEEECRARSAVLRESTFRALGGARPIVFGYLERVVVDLNAEEAEACASFFDRLVTPSGAKVACSAGDLERWAGDRGALVKPLLDRLVRGSILRSVPGPPGESGEVRYEIFHDVLAPAILNWLSRRNELELALKLAQKERDLARERERAQVLKITSVGLGLAFLGIVLFAVAAFAAKRRAEAAERKATREEQVRAAMETSRMLEKAAAAVGTLRQGMERALTSDPELAIVLARAGLRTGKDPDAFDLGLRRGVQLSHVARIVHHRGPVHRVVFSPSGDLVATASDDGTAKIVRVATGDELCALPVGTPVLSASFLDDHRIVTGDGRGVLRSWTLNDGCTPAPWTGSFPDGKGVDDVVTLSARYVFAASGTERTPPGVYRWDLSKPKADPVRFSVANSLAPGGSWRSGLSRLAVSADGRYVAGANEESLTQVWTVDGSDLLFWTSATRWAAFGHHRPAFAVGYEDGTVGLWRGLLPHGTPSVSLGNVPDTVGGAFVGGDDEGLLVGQLDGTLSFWRLPTGEPGGPSSSPRRLAHWATRGDITSIAASPQGTVVATSNNDGSAYLWNLRAGVRNVAFERSGARFVRLLEGDRLVVMFKDRMEIDTLDGRRDRAVAGSNGWRGATSGDGSRFVGITRAGDVVLDPLGSTAPKPSACGFADWNTMGTDMRGRHVCFVRASEAVVCGVDERTREKWTVPDGDDLGELGDCSLSADGDLVALSGKRAGAVYEIRPPHRRRTEYRGRFDMSQFSLDGQRLFLLDHTGKLATWSIADGSLAPWPGETGHVSVFTISADGKVLVTADNRGVARVWSTDDGATEAARSLEIYVSEMPLLDVDIGADGKTLVVLSDDDTVHVYDLVVARQDLDRIARESITRDATAHERKLYLSDASRAADAVVAAPHGAESDEGN